MINTVIKKLLGQHFSEISTYMVIYDKRIPKIVDNIKPNLHHN